jgi:poly(3-hydroxybutyrate) depolymerase
VQAIWQDGGFSAWRTQLGDFVDYVPLSLQEPVQAIVLAHGSIPSQETALDRATGYAQLAPWVNAANRYGMILVAPAFDRINFWNHRELEGEIVSADTFVLRILATYEARMNNFDRKIYLYGHSAGGQFAHRFAVTHPQRLYSLVVSAAGNYARPDDEIPWPFGRDGSPNPDGFATITNLPIAVVVGGNDIYPDGMGGEYQKGENRIERGYYWVQEMGRLAQSTGVQPRINFVEVPGVPHDTVGLTQTAVQYLLR